MKDVLMKLGRYAERISNIDSLKAILDSGGSVPCYCIEVTLKNKEVRVMYYGTEEDRNLAFDELTDKINSYIEAPDVNRSKEVEMAAPKLRRRKPKGEIFYAIEVDNNGEFMDRGYVEDYDEVCNSYYINFNYYWTEEECKEAITKLSRLRKTLHPDYPSEQN